ncbi:ArgE/DapE family deacylase [Arthrobacter sp. B2a2-09]|uniref:ArgE/DapE family deacylase n=1 Tax=Arthrobacter sp. B2a2-09 TaxID=2952822 RepID=UPI0022CD51B6|nr:ArgE/DapE family deacylase [Arthrobacter sp. B2a2-09]MCZ9882262.1 ArgE/DapE family deacylase [Arthrobacter sp. B2a2-09]
MTQANDDCTMESVVTLLSDLIAIDSSNPDLVPGSPGETEIADYVSRWLDRRGFDIHRLEARPGRPSIVAIARGTGGGRSLMMNGHLDTVTLKGYEGDPLLPVVKDGNIYGRGAFDMKSGLAAMMVAAATVAEDGHRGDIILALVADEEYASAGTKEVLGQFSADAAIVSEPSYLEVTIAHKGFVWFEVTVEGIAAHGSRPDLGTDAIARTGRFLVGLDRLAKQLATGHGHPMLGNGSIHASLISGGEELSSYPARCTVSVERRTVPGETPETAEAELSAILAEVSEEDPDFRYNLRRAQSGRTFETQLDQPIVQATLNAAERVLGRSASLRGEPFWTDCALLAERGIPCLLFGVEGGGAHAPTEWASVESLRDVTRILTETVRDFCG